MQLLTAKQQLQALGVGVTLEQMQTEHEAEEGGDFKFSEVSDGPELNRILHLPRRPPPSVDSDEAVEIAEFFTQRLARVADPYPGSLRPVQGISLAEAFEARGLAAHIEVGGGKMLLAYLLPTIMEAKRPLYLCPSNMVKETRAEFKKYARSWHGPDLHRYVMKGYELLAHPNQGQELNEAGEVIQQALLERLAPDVIIMDESHRAKDSGTTTAKRIKAYLKAHPDTIVCYMSGTPFVTSIKDDAHIIAWALKGGSPLPNDFQEREAWASALDAKNKEGFRAGFGALEYFLDQDEKRKYNRKGNVLSDRMTIIRQAIARRILETPGVVGTQSEPLKGVELVIRSHVPSRVDEDLSDIIKTFEETWTLPDGTEIADAKEFAAKMKCLGLGYFPKWVPDPPTEYVLARNTWAKWCRKAIKYNQKGIDSEAKMKEAVRKGVVNDKGVLAAWEAEDKLYRATTGLREPPSIGQWVSDEAIDCVRDWVADHAGIVWVNSLPLAGRLESDLGLTYYGELGMSSEGKFILNHPKGVPCVASIKANGTGRNLQHQFFENLWMTPPHEQALGRTHRPGQKSPIVENWVYLGCYMHYKGYMSAKDVKSKFASEMLLSNQKLGYATDKMLTYRQIMELGSRWNPPGANAEKD